jgi:hypothetical protein
MNRLHRLLSREDRQCLTEIPLDAVLEEIYSALTRRKSVARKNIVDFYMHPERLDGCLSSTLELRTTAGRRNRSAG